MAVDVGIYSNLLQRPKSIAEYDAENLANNANALNLQQARQGVEDQNALRAATAQFGNDSAANLTKLRQAGLYKQSQDYAKSMQDAQKSQADITHANAQTANLGSQVTSRQLEDRVKAHNFLLQKVRAVNTPEDLQAWISEGVQTGAIPQEQAGAAFAKAAPMFSQPGGAQAWQAQAEQGGMTVHQRLQQDLERTKQAEQSRQFGVTSSETARAHRANEGIAGAQLALSRQRESREAQAPKGIWDAERGILINPRDGTTVEAMAPDGVTPLGPRAPKLKDIPATVNAKIMEGAQSVTNIDSAIAAVQANKGAFGMVNAIPGVERLRQGDTRGVDARAQVANIGSLTLHDRSGAAVSASEFPRLAPFIPSASDSAEAIVTKLQKMKKIAEDELGLYAGTYGEDSGYKPSPVLKGRDMTPTAPAGPKAGTVQSGYRFKGGDPADQKNWEKM